jgi:FAD:protein FMN transferase
MLVGLVLIISSASSPPMSQLYQFNYENVLGTSFELKVMATNELQAAEAEEAALKEIDRLQSILSGYDPTSEFSRWQYTQFVPVAISPELFEVLTLFDQWKVKTGGALNASAGVAVNLWNSAAAKQQVPTSEQLALAVHKMSQPQWQLDPARQTATHLSSEPLVFNSFVKSYIISKVSDKIKILSGISGSVINIGGDILVTGKQNEVIRIANPKADAENDLPLSTLNVSNKAIATSGNYRRGFQIGEQWFSHIFDARTAIPVSEIISTTVIADNATDAGALATAFNILSIQESASLAAQIPGVEYLLITNTGEQIVSSGWNNMLVENNKIAGSMETAVQSDYELSIEFELARFEGRFRRPFVAVWIEDKNKEPIRNIAVWYNKSRWLPDLKRWYTKYQSSNMDAATLSSISSATRSAGKYTLVWDGTDDKGKKVPNGKYTIYIEAAREHGTYQLIKQEVEWNTKAKHTDITGGVEITSASLDFHKVVKN